MLMEKFEPKCEFHNKALTLIESDDGFCNYICTQCEKERHNVGV